jgi:hypothetical protein
VAAEADLVTYPDQGTIDHLTDQGSDDVEPDHVEPEQAEPDHHLGADDRSLDDGSGRSRLARSRARQVHLGHVLRLEL